MASLRVVAVLQAKPGSEDALRAALEDIVEPTRAEAGCLAYDLFSSNIDPTTFITIEEWRSQEDVDAHMTTPHVSAALAAAGSVLAVEPRIHPLTHLH